MYFADQIRALAQNLGWSVDYDDRDSSISIRTPEKSMAVSQEDSAEDTIYQILDFLVELKNQRKAEGMSDRLDGLEKQVKSVKEPIESMKSLFTEPESDSSSRTAVTDPSASIGDVKIPEGVSIIEVINLL